jgi:hypothetical protein
MSENINEIDPLSDSLEAMLALIGKNYTTRHFDQKMHVPSAKEKLQMLKSINDCSLYISQIFLVRWAKSMTRKNASGSFAGAARVLKMKLDSENETLDWRELVMEGTIEEHMAYTTESRAEKRNQLLAGPFKTYTDEHGCIIDLWENRTNALIQHIISEHLKIGKLSLYNHTQNCFINNIQYYGSGLRAGMKAGSGWVTWVYESNIIHRQNTWLI